jgi:phospholipase C
MVKTLYFLIMFSVLTACQVHTPVPALITPTHPSTATVPPSLTPTNTPNPTPTPLIPYLDPIAILIFENKEFTTVIGNPDMPNFNRYAREYTLLTQHYAIRHPSLPNYIALISGDTFGIDHTCVDCFIDAPSLPDLIESAGLSWKTYQEHMPSPCYKGETLRYFQKHNPFMYFDAIRLDQTRCERSVVPLDQLELDLEAQQLPNYLFIVPDICNSAHDCDLKTADVWLGNWVEKLLTNPEMAENGLIIITWDEGQGEHSCCNLPTGGGRIATILISRHVNSGFEDETSYTHYSLLKTISTAWNLPLLGHAADPETNLIIAPWK